MKVGGIQLQINDSLFCKSCPFDNVCYYYGVSVVDELDDHCIIIDLNRPWIILSTPDYAGGRLVQVFDDL